MPKAKMDFEKKTACSYCGKKKFPYKRRGTIRTGYIKKFQGSITQFCSRGHYEALRDEFLAKVVEDAAKRRAEKEEARLEKEKAKLEATNPVVEETPAENNEEKSQ